VLVIYFLYLNGMKVRVKGLTTNVKLTEILFFVFYAFSAVKF